MYKKGHHGVAMILCSPVMLVLTFFELYFLAIVFGFISIFFSTVPDLDMNLAFVKHRGFTHTVWFAMLFGLASGLVMFVASSVAVAYFESLDTVDLLTISLVSLLGGFSSVIFHILGDVLTPTGVKPFSFGRLGISNRLTSENKYTLNIVKAENSTANFLLWVLGMCSLFVAIGAGSYLSSLV